MTTGVAAGAAASMRSKAARAAAGAGADGGWGAPPGVSPGVSTPSVRTKSGRWPALETGPLGCPAEVATTATEPATSAVARKTPSFGRRALMTSWVHTSNTR